MIRNLLLMTGLAIVTLPAPGFAQTAPAPVNVSSLTAAVDYSSITTNVLAAGAIVIGASLVIVAIRWVRKVF
jgi:hypothetical protein